MTLHLAAVSFLLLLPLSAQTFVRVRDDVILPRPAAPPVSSLTSVTAAHCGTLLGARDGDPIVNAPGSTLSTNAFMNPACINRRGQLAFVGAASGARNQGIFVADQNGVRAIAMGCGQGGGSGQHGSCGDPSPVGGTFAGFFTGTTFAPPLNDDGDVLFLADLANAPIARGLFLYLAGAQAIVKVCGVGDASPRGGSITALGPGCLSRDRTVLFLAQSTGSPQYVADILQWQNGVVTVFSATGSPAPGSGTVSMLGTESFGFVDGTTVFAGPVPAINDCEQVAYRIITTAGSRGIAVRQNGQDSWYVTDAMATPNGGSYVDFQAAAINGGGEIAFFADYRQSSGMTSGWFVGRPGSWRHALSFLDPVDGGQCHGLAFSRNPMTFLSDDGDVVVWCDLNPNGNMGRIVLCASDGSRTILARQGSATGAGGNFGTIDAWPAMNSSGRVSISAGTPGAGWTSAHLIGVLCGPAVASSPCVSPGDTVRVDDFGPAGSAFLLAASFTTFNLALPPFGTLLIGPQVVLLAGPTSYPGLSGPHTLSIPVPNVAALNGLSVHFQSLALGPSSTDLTNRATTRVQ